MDIKHYYEEDGCGFPLVLLHGNGEDSGYIALLFAMKYPEYVRNLVLNGANLNPGGVKPQIQIPIVLGFRVAGLFASKSAKAKRNQELLGLMVLEPELSPQDLKKVQARTLVIAGTRDMIRGSHTEEIKRGIAGSRLVLLPGDHFIANKNPEKFNTAVMAFLRPEDGSGQERKNVL